MVNGADDGCSLGTTSPSVTDGVGWMVNGADDGCSLGTTSPSVTDGVGWTVDGCVADSDGEDDGS